MMQQMMRRVRRAGAALALSSLAVADACYAYVPVADGAPTRRSDQLRVVLTSEGTRELARYLGPGVRAAEGAVADVDSSGTITLAVVFVELNNGVKMPWTGEGVVGFPAAMRESVNRHAFQRPRTIVASMALAAALVVTAVLALRQGGAGGDGSGGPPPPPP